MRQFIISILLMVLALAVKAGAAVEAVWSTGVAVPGEQVMLYVLRTPAQNEQY